jgi:uncharacterized DUF497 family protein
VFSWDAQKAILNFEKHGVSFEEAATIFSDPEGLDWADAAHSRQEARYKRLGISIRRRILLVVYTTRRSRDGKEAIRIISARPASRKERKAYSG